jgi:hypothetical protein
MKTSSKALLFIAAISSSIACSQPRTAASLRAPPKRPDIGRGAARDKASDDAQSQFGTSDVSWALETRTGDVWLVDLARADGLSLQYTIAASNGAIRGRRIRR